MNRKLWLRNEPNEDLRHAETPMKLFEAAERRLIALPMALEVSDRTQRIQMMSHALTDVCMVIEHADTERLRLAIERIADNRSGPSDDDRRLVGNWARMQIAHEAERFGVVLPARGIRFGKRVIY